MASHNFTNLSDPELIDFICVKTNQADALMTMCTGEGFEAFSLMSEVSQHEYLSTVATMIADIRQAHREATQRR